MFFFHFPLSPLRVLFMIAIFLLITRDRQHIAADGEGDDVAVRKFSLDGL